jgi:hypothetical protein
MKKVIALSIGLAFSAGSIAQEQIQAASTMEKTQAIVKDIIHFAKNNTTPTNTGSILETKANETLKVEVKTEAKVEIPKVETKENKDAKPLSVKDEPVKQDPKVKSIKKEEAKKEEVKLIVMPKVEQKVEKSAKNESCVDTPVKSEAPKTKKVVAKKKVKHIKKIVKPIEPMPEVKTTLPVVQNASLLGADYYYVPKHATLEQYSLFSKPISYDDVELKVDNKDSKFIISLVDKRIDKPLDSFYLSNSKVNVLNLTTDLEKKEPIEIQYDESDAYEISFDNNQGCRAVFFEYKLNNQDESKVVTKLIDASGNFINKLPVSCKENISDLKDTTFYTSGGNIINIGFAQKQTAEKGSAMQVHFTKEGHEFTPDNLKAYAISKDFATGYILNAKTNAKGPYFGMDVSRKVPTGSYFIFIGYEQGNQVEWIKTSISVQ